MHPYHDPMVAEFIPMNEAKKEPTLHDVIRNLQAYSPAADLNMVQRAFVFAEQHHRKQRRKNGAPYIGHPVAVAQIACMLKLDVEAVCAALMHDTIEDTGATFEEIRDIFSESIADLVEGVTKLNKIRFRSQEEKQAENFRKMLLAMSKDIRVILVKLADRTHNMRTLEHLAPDKQITIARETMDIFAPLANRLGLGAIKMELEDLSFQYLFPVESEQLREQVNSLLLERRQYILDVIGVLEELLQREGVKAQVRGRPKHFWSIYRKMQIQRIPFEKVHDLIAFRVLVHKQPECYHVLGLIHDRWKPIPGRFKDYIALPKANKYQSLHTAVIGPSGLPVEVQVRTHDMHHVAESGIAAHWKYKDVSGPIDQSDEERFGWLKQLMEWQRELDDPSEFLESVKVELFADEVYTFTPKGELKVLPRGSTPVDFAYSIHSEVGNQCSGAIVNGSIAPLDYELRNGDTCEILTNRTQRPSKDWLRFVRTNRAKARIRAVIRREQRERSLELGEQLLEKELRRHSRSLARIRKAPELLAEARSRSLETVEELIVQVGSGKVTAQSIVASLLPEETAGKVKPVEALSINPFSRLLRRMTGGPSGVVVDGLDGVKHSIAKCCSPVPGEAIAGYVTQGHVVSVHRRNCVNTVDLPPEREVEVCWGNSGDTGYPVSMKVMCESGIPGMLSSISRVFADLKVNIDSAHCAEAADGRAENIFTFHVTDVEELKQVTRQLNTLKGVFGIERLRQS
jgi:guanosine-3',5'-bis(diphosphate) 3'-pyrophosphohydrolase